MRSAQLHSCSRITLLAVVLCAGCDRSSQQGKSTGESSATRQVYALGRLEPADGVISISALPGERLKELDPDVVENQRTPANGILGKLASYDLGLVRLKALNKKVELAREKRLHEVEIASAQQAQAEASLSQAQAKQKELLLQKDKIVALGIASQLAAEEYAQLFELSQTDPELVTSHQLAKQANRMEIANQDYKIANESYDATKNAADKAVAAAEASGRVTQIALDHPKADYEQKVIEQEIKIAKETLKRSLLLAPHVDVETLDVIDVKCEKDHSTKRPKTSGPDTVLKVFIRPGEFITQTPIIQLGNLSKMACIAEVYEADVQELVEGLGVTIRSPAFSGKFADGPLDPTTKQRSGGIRGTIERISSLVASPGLSNRNPLAPADRSVVEVRIAIDAKDQAATEHAARCVNLQVTVEFDENEPAEAKANQQQATP